MSSSVSESAPVAATKRAAVTKKAASKPAATKAKAAAKPKAAASKPAAAGRPSWKDIIKVCSSWLPLFYTDVYNVGVYHPPQGGHPSGSVTFDYQEGWWCSIVCVCVYCILTCSLVCRGEIPCRCQWCKLGSIEPCDRHWRGGGIVLPPQGTIWQSQARAQGQGGRIQGGV